MSETFIINPISPTDLSFNQVVGFVLTIVITVCVVLLLHAWLHSNSDRKWVIKLVRLFYAGLDTVPEQYVCDRAVSTDLEFHSMAYNKLFGHPLDVIEKTLLTRERGESSFDFSEDGECVFLPSEDAQDDVIVTVKSVCVEEPVFGNVQVDDKAIVLKKHRRVSDKERYAITVVAEIKCKLGLPNDTPANRLVIRRMANNIMENHKVRPTHIKRVISMIVELVLLPDVDDCKAIEIKLSCSAKECRRLTSTWHRVSRWFGLNPTRPNLTC